ncbi:MAG: hypothetical protein LUH36_03765 [Oscillospiraceae bacterium]|nr:hypothetical protein [Oscillospiraceae bacterium]
MDDDESSGGFDDSENGGGPDTGDKGTEAPENTENHEASDAKDGPASTELLDNKDAGKELMDSKPAASEGLMESCGTGKAEAFELSEEAKEGLTTKPDTAYFWSGLEPITAENGEEILECPDIADIMASARHGTTLENTIASNHVELPPYDPHNIDSIKAWDAASREYASRASGEVYVVLGNELREGSTFMRVEYPTLMENDKVTRITAIDSETGKETVLADRQSPENNKTPVSYTNKNGRSCVRFE